jgi:hypothetical protein
MVERRCDMIEKYAELVKTATDSWWLEQEIHKMAIIIAAPGANAETDLRVRLAMAAIDLLVQRLSMVDAKDDCPLDDRTGANDEY